uniref:Uncharacterized protein LOC104215499 n=1 Tax=Nicotiana sylvestris TaxID=4096 RepID=A0A1U7VB70_NICSY|nr:PREDICTED: uncharacterized protein LOC104215499 [Nicotiana sylvestris]
MVDSMASTISGSLMTSSLLSQLDQRPVNCYASFCFALYLLGGCTIQDDAVAFSRCALFSSYAKYFPWGWKFDNLVALEPFLLSPFWKATTAIPSDTFGKAILTRLNRARKSLNPSPGNYFMANISFTLASAFLALALAVTNLSDISSNVSLELACSCEYQVNAPPVRVSPTFFNKMEDTCSLARSLPFTEKLALRYGPFMLIRAGASSSYIVSNGAITKEIFKTNDINFAARPEFGSSEYQITKTPCFPLWTIARTDTTSVALQWALAELLNHPKSIKKLQQEIDRIVGVKNRLAEDLDIQNLPYLQAVVKETLRLHPSLPLVFRKCREDCEINGYKILKDSRLVVNLYAVNRDSNVWADADDFVPKRYLNLNENLAIEPDELEAIKEDQNFCYMPFGGRRRGCPGAGLAAAVLHRTLVQ